MGGRVVLLELYADSDVEADMCIFVDNRSTFLIATDIMV
jgi:hypothetical protein